MTFSPSEGENVYEGSSIHLIKKIIKFDLPAMLTNSNSQDPPFVQFFFFNGSSGLDSWGLLLGGHRKIRIPKHQATFEKNCQIPKQKPSYLNKGDDFLNKS